MIVRLPRAMAFARLLKILTVIGGGRVALVVPPGARAFKETINLELLAMFARDRRLEITVVSVDESLRGLADQAGLPVSVVLPQEFLAEEAAGAEEAPRQTNHVPVWALIPLALIVPALALFLLWPRPMVVVAAARQRLTLSVQARVSPEYRENQIGKGLLPARQVSKSGLVVYNVPTTGSRVEGITPAHGQAILINDSNAAVIVPAGAILQTADGLRFRTQAAATVPAAQGSYLVGIKVGSKSGQTTVGVSAELAGSRGNIDQGKITALLGPQGRLIKAVNTAAFTGGTDRRVPLVAEADVERALAEARRQMELQAPDELGALSGTDAVIFYETVSITTGKTTAIPAAGEEGESVRVSLPYIAKCLVLDRQTLGKYLVEQAAHSVPQRFALAKEGFTVQEIKGGPVDNGQIRVKITATYGAIGRLDRSRILRALAGKTEAEARTALLALPEVASVHLDLPLGRRLPRVGWLIKLVLPKTDEP